MKPSEFEALTGVAVASAKRLEKLWINRERELRKRDEGKTPSGATRESDAVRRCRIELQKEFGLNANMTEQLIMEENGKRYRMLMVGETLEAGDEVNYDGWHVLHPLCVGCKIAPDSSYAFPQGYYRRPIQ